MAKDIWKIDEYSIENAIYDGYRGVIATFDDNGHVQKVKVDDDGTAHVDWYAPSNSKQKHWHFVFKLDENGKVIPGSGRLVHN